MTRLNSAGLLLLSETKTLRKRTCLADQLLCGSVPTRNVSCTKFKIHSAHADSPMAKTIFSSFYEEEKTLSGPTPLSVRTYTSYLLYKVQGPFTPCRQYHGQNIFFKFFFSVGVGWTSLCFTDQETQEENTLNGPSSLWVSTYTSCLLNKAQGPFSLCRQSYDLNTYF